LFLDPVVEMMPIARELGADRVELYTEPYAAAAAAGRGAESAAQYGRAAAAARAVGLGVNAGHDLSLENLAVFVQGAGPIDEVSIGHALIADALELGMAETVRRYLARCGTARA
jgi:pyridoxine 5-phosphate synthase